MRDQQHDLFAAQVLQHGVHLRAPGVVQCRGRLVEDHDRRIAQERSGEGDALLLPAGEHAAVLRQIRIISIRKGQDGLVDIRLLAGGCRLLARGGRLAEKQILHDRPRQKDILLRHDGDERFIVLRPERFCVDAHEDDIALLRMQSATEQAHERTLARTIRAAEQMNLPGAQAESHPVQDILSARIGKGHIFERDAGIPGQAFGFRRRRSRFIQIAFQRVE